MQNVKNGTINLCLLRSWVSSYFPGTQMMCFILFSSSLQYTKEREKASSYRGCNVALKKRKETSVLYWSIAFNFSSIYEVFRLFSWTWYISLSRWRWTLLRSFYNSLKICYCHHSVEKPKKCFYTNRVHLEKISVCYAPRELTAFCLSSWPPLSKFGLS